MNTTEKYDNPRVDSSKHCPHAKKHTARFTITKQNTKIQTSDVDKSERVRKKKSSCSPFSINMQNARQFLGVTAVSLAGSGENTICNDGCGLSSTRGNQQAKHLGKTETEEKRREAGGKGINQKGATSEAGAFCTTVVATDAPLWHQIPAIGVDSRILAPAGGDLARGASPDPLWVRGRVRTPPPISENRRWLSSGVSVALTQKNTKETSRRDEGENSKPQPHPPETKLKTPKLRVFEARKKPGGVAPVPGGNLSEPKQHDRGDVTKEKRPDLYLIFIS